MTREYACAECGRKNDAAPGEPLAMKECGSGCGNVFCLGCLPDHESVCGKSVPDATGCSIDIDERIGG